jgi:hypothetical protein
MKHVYADYFQKSKTFIYPVLGIAKRSSIQVEGTYISWLDIYNAADKKLICVYKDVDSEAFKAFEAKVLLSSPLYHSHQKTKDNRGIYIFDMNIIRKDWAHFLSGSYSKMSKTLKDAVLKYYAKSPEYEYARSYLYPEEFFEIYSSLLDVDKKLLLEVGQLCDKYNHDLENLKIPVEELQSSAEFV